MMLSQYLLALEMLHQEALLAFSVPANVLGIRPAAELELARTTYLGARSRVKEFQMLLGGIAKEDKPAAVQKFKDVKGSMTAAFETALSHVHEAAE